MTDTTSDKLYLLPYKPDGRGGNKAHPACLRDNAEREHDLYLIAGMYLRKHTGKEILQAINANREAEGLEPIKNVSTIFRDIEEIHRRWVNSALIDFNEAKGRELDEWNHLEQTYWDAYERSLEDKEVTEIQKLTDEIAFAVDQVVPVTRTKKKRRVEKRDGLMQALAGVERCIEQRCKILGLYSPDKIQVDWRVEAQRAGLPESTASQMFDELVEKYVEAMESEAEGNTVPDTG